jgi:hypothetical protein
VCKDIFQNRPFSVRERMGFEGAWGALLPFGGGGTRWIAMLIPSVPFVDVLSVLGLLEEEIWQFGGEHLMEIYFLIG